ncbi:hypothetical protein GCK72_015110 [Caenorhabditis remanei]|uniref:SXP/RAL-2 family protein Ani s 5-like cation-binding domain-containing protein n=1 Tax=Caenorhabditis remanei TaxID=31234 RepID=A0A6A5GVM3_CAERE|nr:hypothetical protein GCK72_015110 [Caenorhabditis remanei]KAF1758651.1 hypothetical protein GCK72_015110 [Caenorhabditis remanei]
MLFLLSTLLFFTSFAASAPVLTVSEEMEQIFQNLTTEGQEDYFQILFNDTVTLREMDHLWDQWAEKHGISDKWTAYSGKWETRKEKFHNTVLSVIENLPSAYRMMTEITSNRDQTINQVHEALDQLKETYNMEVSMISFLSKMMVLNEEYIMNGGNVEIGNEVSQDLRRMRDYKKNRGLNALLVPGPLV